MSSCAPTKRIRTSPLYNHDLAPVPVAQRNWTTYNYAALWISMAHCIPTYMLASGLMAAGMNWWQALFTILLGNTIVLDPDPAQLAPGHEVRHPVPGVRARRVRHARLERAGADARARRLRLVRHPGVDRRRGAAHVLHDASFPAGRRCSAPAFGGHTTDRVAVVPAVLGAEHLHHLSRHGPAARGRELGGAVRARHDRAAARGGRSRQRARPRPAARAAGQVPHASASSGRCSSRR